MAVKISAADQENVDQLRSDLAKVVIELAAMNVVDIDSQNVQARAIGKVQSIKEQLDRLGIRHSCMQAGAHG
jgi:hypothetical protein